MTSLSLHQLNKDGTPEHFTFFETSKDHRLAFDSDSANEPQFEAKTENTPSKKQGRGRPEKVIFNSLHCYLQGLSSPGHALSTLPHFDNIVTGAVNIDFDGNTRPFSKKLMITLLKRLDTISAKAVREYMHSTLRSCSLRHSQKIVQCLSIIINASKKIAEEQWSPSGDFDEHGNHHSAGYVTPCGNEDCSVCAGSVKWNGDDLYEDEIQQHSLFEVAERDWSAE